MMKRTTTIVLFASIFAVTAGTLGLGGTFATSLTIASPQAQQVDMTGHVEYIVHDASKNIVQYWQGDNVVVNRGEDCSAEAIFGDPQNQLNCTNGLFNYVGIGNHSSVTTNPGNQTLADSNDKDTIASCAGGSPGAEGDMARRQVTVSHQPASGARGAVVTLDTSSNPFTFDATNATTVFDAGIFNGNYDGTVTNGQCPTGTQQDVGAGGDWDMFSRQLLNSPGGITVSAGDTLSVRWTVTVG